MPSITEEINTDANDKLFETGKSSNLTRFYIPDLQYSAIGMFIIHRLMHDRDVKIIITSSGKTTGTGKTTLAILLAKWINTVRNDIFDLSEEWTAKEYAFMDKYEYSKKYKNAKPGDCLITDELEYMADRRNFMYDDQKKFTQMWSMLRYKNVITIGTAPGMMDLEKRLPETADIWINVQYPGRANVYFMGVHDFEWISGNALRFKRFKMYGYRESILWNEIAEDPDYIWLKEQKEDLGVPGIDDTGQRIDESYVKDKVSQTKTNVAKNVIKKLDEKGEFYKVNQQIRMENYTQTDIAYMSGWSQDKISELIREMYENSEILNGNENE